MRFPSRKVPAFEPMRIAKGTRCPYALDSNTIPFHASASKAPIWTSENFCATCAARDNGRNRARKIAGCSHRAPRRRTRCLYRRSPVPSWLVARERLPVDLLASFIRGSAHFREGELMKEITTVGVNLAKDLIVVCAGDAQWLWSAEMAFRGESPARANAQVRVALGAALRRAVCLRPHLQHPHGHRQRVSAGPS